MKDGIKSKVRNYLYKHGRITKLYAAKEIGTDALKDVIYALRNEGMIVSTQSKRDFAGAKYTEWHLKK